MRALRWIGIGLLGLAGLLLVALIAIYISSNIRLNKVYQIAAERALPPGMRGRR